MTQKYNDYRSDRLFYIQAGPRYAGQILPNFPLLSNDPDYNRLLRDYGVNINKRDRRYKDVFLDCRQHYPQTQLDSVATQYYFQKNHSCPTASLSKQGDALELIFPIYKSTRHYFSCCLPLETVQEMIETETDIIRQHSHHFKMDRNYEYGDLTVDLITDIENTNKSLIHNFEKITGRKIRTPFDILYAPDSLAQFSDNGTDLLVCPTLANSYESNSQENYFENQHCLTDKLSRGTASLAGRFCYSTSSNWLRSNS